MIPRTKVAATFRNMTIFTVLAISLSSCEIIDECSDFPSSLSDTEVEGPRLEEKKEIDESDRLLENRIRKCYDDSTYIFDNSDLMLESIRIGDDGYTYLFFEHQGVLDLWLVFRVSEEGFVASAFSYSPLSRFDVPAY